MHTAFRLSILLVFTEEISSVPADCHDSIASFGEQFDQTVIHLLPNFAVVSTVSLSVVNYMKRLR